MWASKLFLLYRDPRLPAGADLAGWTTLAQPPFYRAFSILGDSFSQTRLKPEEKARRKRAFPGGCVGVGQLHPTVV